MRKTKHAIISIMILKISTKTSTTELKSEMTIMQWRKRRKMT